MKLTITLSSFLLMSVSAYAAPLKSAVVTTVVKDVKVSENRKVATKAPIGTKLTHSSTLLTGRESRAAMTFPDQTITRVGANTIFKFSSHSRDMELKQGSFLLQVPKGAGGATVRMGTVTAAITGTTVLLEFKPGEVIKFVVLEGVAKLVHQNGTEQVVTPGTKITMKPGASSIPLPLSVSVQDILATSPLTDKATFGELSPEALVLINETITKQVEQAKAAGQITDTTGGTEGSIFVELTTNPSGNSTTQDNSGQQQGGGSGNGNGNGGDGGYGNYVGDN